MSADTLITRYRPQDFSYVYGHREAVTSLQSILEYNQGHSFLFTGPTGIGKTTLARLVAKSVGATVEEVDAGKYSGIDDMKELTGLLRFRPIAGDNLCIILNECQSLSKKAWDSILMSVEEPPEWLYWCLTTTELDKVPLAIKKGRCSTFTLKPVSANDLTDLLEAIKDAESFNTTDAVIALCVRSANGSPRAAIASLNICKEIQDVDQAARLLEEAESSTESLDLVRALMSGKKWNTIQPILEKLKETDPETIRQNCRGYITAAILNTKDEAKAAAMFELLDAFSEPFLDRDKLSPVVLAVGRILFA